MALFSLHAVVYSEPQQGQNSVAACLLACAQTAELFSMTSADLQ